MSAPLTPKQLNLLRWIYQEHQQKGVFPSQKEMAAALGVSSLGTVQNFLVRLERQGWIQRGQQAKRVLQFSSRALQWLKAEQGRAEEESIFRIPVLGRAAAGYAIESSRESEEILEIPRSWLAQSERRAPHQLFGVRVVGESMLDAGVLPGDWAIVRRWQGGLQEAQTQISKRSMVVMRRGSEALIKFFKVMGDEIHLRSANPQYPDFVWREGADDVVIEGIVVGLWRRLQP